MVHRGRAAAAKCTSRCADARPQVDFIFDAFDRDGDGVITSDDAVSRPSVGRASPLSAGTLVFICESVRTVMCSRDGFGWLVGAGDGVVGRNGTAVPHARACLSACVLVGSTTWE